MGRRSSIGLGKDEFFVASDIPAILAHTRDVVFLGDEEMAVITRSGVQFTDYQGRAVSKTTQRARGIRSQRKRAATSTSCSRKSTSSRPPRATRSSDASRSTAARSSSRISTSPEDTLRSVQKVSIIACGTSWHAALVGKYLIEALAQVPVEVDYGSEYRYRNPIVAANELAIVITQSGETADTLAALREAKRKGAP
mgnify:CR=1 FL=1